MHLFTYRGLRVHKLYRYIRVITGLLMLSPFLIGNLSEETVHQQLEDILEKSVEDISFTIQSVTAIKESDDYGGYRASILCLLENIRQVIHQDIATGDIVTPQPITYYYKPIFTSEQFPIIAYTIETILAEKLQTIYSRSFLNSRSKDF